MIVPDGDTTGRSGSTVPAGRNRPAPLREGGRTSPILPVRMGISGYFDVSLTAAGGLRDPIVFRPDPGTYPDVLAARYRCDFSGSRIRSILGTWCSRRSIRGDRAGYRCTSGSSFRERPRPTWRRFPGDWDCRRSRGPSGILTCWPRRRGCFLASRSDHAGLWAFNTFSRVASGLLLGATLSAMLLGHYYLIAPAMTIEPLKRSLDLIAAGCVARASSRGSACGFGAQGPGGSDSGRSRHRPDVSRMRWGIGLRGYGPVGLPGAADRRDPIDPVRDGDPLHHVDLRAVRGAGVDRGRRPGCDRLSPRAAVSSTIRVGSNAGSPGISVVRGGCGFRPSRDRLQ